ncbi:hypothetical protein BDR04DRAFT_1226574 [Suillus decipiens]|nr:hypothetical protein BDR04DRAFT_1226574 [Suillus decipiens]
MTFVPLSASMALVGRSEVLAATSNAYQSSKPILEQLSFVIAIAAVLFLVTARICVLRRRRRSVTQFFSIRPSNPYGISQAPADHTFSSSYEPSYRMHRLTPLPSVYLPDRRVNAADIDSAGRRIGGPDDPDWDGKDILPAYNKFDRPPKYNFSGMPSAEGYTPPAENYSRDATIVANTEAIPAVEGQSVASERIGHSNRDDSVLSAPRHEYPQTPS